jgi:large subunit ribosomal protein L31
MKADIHPKLNHVIFSDGEFEIVTRSTLSSRETREVNGVKHFVIPIEISAYTHPFFTGRQKLLDTAGRIDRFKKKYGREG